jgi:hypothetical protein
MLVNVDVTETPTDTARVVGLVEARDGYNHYLLRWQDTSDTVFGPDEEWYAIISGDNLEDALDVFRMECEEYSEPTYGPEFFVDLHYRELTDLFDLGTALRPVGDDVWRYGPLPK